MLGTTKASCQLSRSAPGVGREDHEQQIEVFNPPTLCPVGLIPAGLVLCNSSSPRGFLELESLFQGAVELDIISAHSHILV